MPDAGSFRILPAKHTKKAVVILNPVKENLPERWQGERRKEIVNFCRLEKQKNLPLLIEAFCEFHKKHADYTLAIYGDGKERESLEEYIRNRKLDDCVTLHHAVSDIHDHIKDAMMFVSSSNYEGLSNSMIEAMAIGLPTICTDCPCGGARMVIRDGENGLLVSTEKRTELSQAMCEIADNSNLRFALSIEGEKIREKLSKNNIVSEWIRLF